MYEQAVAGIEILIQSKLSKINKQIVLCHAIDG